MEAVSTIANLENKTLNVFSNISRCRVSQHYTHSLHKEIERMKRLGTELNGDVGFLP